MTHLYEVEKTKDITLQSLLSITNLSTTDTFLDFGGNRGNLLTFDEFKILPENYTCIDVDTQAIAQGKQDHPQATFVHYNKHNSVYNNTGIADCPFPLVGRTVDYVFAFSVFTHSDFDELKTAIEWFKTVSTKKIAISVLDINNKYLTDWFYNKRIKEYGSCVDFEFNANIMYLIDNNNIVTNQKTYNVSIAKHFLTFYDLDWLSNELDVNIEYHGKYPFILI